MYRKTIQVDSDVSKAHGMLWELITGGHELILVWWKLLEKWWSVRVFYWVGTQGFWWKLPFSLAVVLPAFLAYIFFFLQNTVLFEVSVIWVCKQKCKALPIEKAGIKSIDIILLWEPVFSRGIPWETCPMGILPVRSHLEILTHSMPLLIYPLIPQVITVFFQVPSSVLDPGLQGEEKQTGCSHPMARMVLKPEVLLCAGALLRKDMLGRLRHSLCL